MKDISVKIIKAHDQPEDQTIQKSLTPTALTDDKSQFSKWLAPPTDLWGFKEMVEHSTILPQCIRAYKDNIAGFGIGIKYRDDEVENDQMKSEWAAAERVVDLLTLDMDTKGIFEHIIEARETYGVAYIEVIRDLAGNVVQIEFIKDTPTIRKTAPLDPPVPISYFYKGDAVARNKKFRQYKQEKNGKTVYFREFGDPRIMDNTTGEYVESGEASREANEILEFTIGTEDYGTVRWIGQSLNVDGSRRAENLNNNYFENGRHTPLAIIVSGGTLTDASYGKLQEYMNDIKGERGQHAFLLLEVEDTDTKVNFENNQKPNIELKDLASILQKDELFQSYLDNSRRKVQSAFRLPDLYVGYTTDFNRATAQTAMEVTEKQVFQPERDSLAWTINNKLLNGYGFKYIEVFFNAPDITNPDDLYKMLTVTERAGGLTPNKAKQITYKTMGWNDEEDYDGEWGEIPLAVTKAQSTSINQAKNPDGSQTIGTASNLAEQVEKAITKAAAARDDDVVAVMKEVKRLLRQRKEGAL